ncbi:MAG: branched-chain amino acid ABC transporter permease [Spirochaetota bacterium]
MRTGLFAGRGKSYLVPFITAGSGALVVFLMDSFLSSYLLSLVNFILINVILAVSLNMTNGFTGLFSLGHPGFMAVGGYTSALLVFPVAKKALFLPQLPGWLSTQQWPLFPALIVGGIAAAVISLIIGFPVLRLKGHYLAVATLGFIIIVQVVVTNMEDITRGPLGLNGLPALTNLWWVYVWVIITVYVAWKLKFSSFGRTMLAMREDELAAQCLGVPLAKTRIIAFAVGAFFAGIAGGLWAHQVTAITPNSFSVITAFTLVVMVVIGGTGSITGSICAAILITLVREALRPMEEASGLYGINQVLVSAGLLLILVFRPRGLFGNQEPIFMRRWSGAEGKK